MASSLDSSASSASATVSAVAEDHPGINELFAVLAYGEIAAFYRLTLDAQMAPDLTGRMAIAKMASAQMGHFASLQDALESRGVDVITAMGPYMEVLDNYHRSTAPSTWLESLVKAYIGDGLAADFYREIVASLPGHVGVVVREVLAETQHSEFVLAQVNAAVAVSAQEKNRLTLWARRLLGEAITQAQFVLAQRDELTDLVLTGSGDLNHLVDFFDRLQLRHAERMKLLGLG
ncbi:MAG: ferritin-like fold-containing protein [Mycobacteriaceae bacterium]